MRFHRFSLLFVVFFSILLAGEGEGQKQEQAQKKDAAPGWVFAFTQNETQLVSMGGSLDEASASRLTWAICGGSVLRVAIAAPARTSDGYQHRAAKSMSVGTYCLLVDSASDNRMFVWGWPDQSDAGFGCVKGFSEAAAELAGRKVDSCYFIGGHGAGSVEVVLYKNQSPTDWLAALIVEDFRDPLIIATGWQNFRPATRAGSARTKETFIRRNSITCSQSLRTTQLRMAMSLRCGLWASSGRLPTASTLCSTDRWETN
jgi:hypothetical protein